jgi:anti-sigma factor RsiW
MDCRSFRKHHLAYLDDTLSGDQMTAAQRHILSCDRCAAHDTMVRRSLLVARNLRMVTPSPEFRSRLRSRIAACKAQDAAFPRTDSYGPAVPTRVPRTVAAVAVTAAVLGTIAWGGFAPAEPPLVAMQPVVATQPAHTPYVSPALMQAMATGNPVWPATMIIDEMPTQFVNASYSLAEELR